jgi:ribosomal protein S18 acetylase RimI-like enzyme
MEIKVQTKSEVDFEELAAFIEKTRGDVIERRGISHQELVNQLAHQWPFIGYGLARSRGELVGCALLFRIGDSDLIEINPGMTLGFHPLIDGDFDEAEVGAALIDASKEYIQARGFDALYIDIPWDPTAPPEQYHTYQDRYGKLGFEVIQQVRQMNRPLPADLPDTSPPAGFKLAQILNVPKEDLFECHHQAYLDGQAQYYFKMDETERRDDFDRIYAENIRQHPASLVLTEGNRAVGYVLLFAEGGFTEVMSLAVHPDYRRRGLGKLLMLECIKQAGEAGHTHMHLIVDSKNHSAEALYRQLGFKDAGGSMTFKWKAG